MTLSRYTIWRRLAQLTPGLVLALLVASPVAADAQAENENPPPQPMSAAEVRETLGKVNLDLLAYATETARTKLGPLADDETTASLVALGRIYEQEKRYAKARECFEKAGELAPGNPAPWIFLGESYLHQKRPDAATGAFEEARKKATAFLAKKPDHPTALYYLGVARQRLEQYGLAVESLKRARELDPSNPMPIYQLGVTDALQQKWQGAVDLLTEALELNQSIAYAYYYRGQSAGKIGRKDMLIADLERFLELAPNAPEAPIAARTVASARR